MKDIIKYLLIFIATNVLLATPACSNTIDFYFANGLNGESQDIEETLWKEYTTTLKASSVYPELKININSTKVAYNASELWGLGDLAEVIPQKITGDAISWSKVQGWLREYVIDNGLIEYFNGKSQKYNSSDLHTQIESYKADLRAGHSIIAVAHSQGNFFTNKVYETLSPCQQKYFKMIGVASPSFVVSGGGPRISFIMILYL